MPAIEYDCTAAGGTFFGEYSECSSVTCDPDCPSDVDGDAITVTIEGFMTEETYETSFDDAGEYEVTVTASDGKLEVSETVEITVNDVNRPPVFIFN